MTFSQKPGNWKCWILNSIDLNITASYISNRTNFQRVNVERSLSPHRISYHPWLLLWLESLTFDIHRFASYARKYHYISCILIKIVVVFHNRCLVFDYEIIKSLLPASVCTVILMSDIIHSNVDQRWRQSKQFINK